VLLKMFGYRKGELEGKNVSMLMPQPYSGRHNGYLRNFQTSGVPKILDRQQEVRDRMVEVERQGLSTARQHQPVASAIRIHQLLLSSIL
jgi:PAS domain S-box-containing protein